MEDKDFMKAGNSRFLLTIPLILTAILICPIAYGKTIYVDDDATGTNDGTSWANAYVYLQDALADANTAEKPVEIRVAQGIYKPDQGTGITPGDREATFQLINGVTLNGGYAGTNEPDPNARDASLYETILSGDLNGDDIGWNELLDIRALQESWLIEPKREDNTYHVVNGSGTDETAVLDGFTIAGGCTTYFEDSGGGMYNHAGSPTVTNCMFKRNSARWDGGGMSSEGNSNPILSNCTFTRNYAFHGGGMYNNNSNPTLTNCAFTDNLTVVPPAIIEHNYRAGSGIYNNRSSPTLTNCTFRGNSADRGGGMYNYQSHSILTNCTFSKNLGGYGAGIYNSESNPALNNCIFSGNFANYGSGGGISGGSPALTNCTFTGNEAEAGGGISGGSPILTNCIVWGNTPPQILADVTISYSNVQGGWPGEGNMDVDPLFVDADGDDDVFGTKDDDLRLLEGSPCIDAGDNSVIQTSVVTDINGNPRIINDVVDMGAYESLLPKLLLSTWSLIVPEGGTAAFTVALAEQPSETIEVNVAFYSGDQDITVESGEVLTFDASNYSVPQTVTLAAAEDSDNLNSIAQILITTDNGLTGMVTATEADNEPDVGVLFVDDDAVGNNNGSNWVDAYINLQEALSAAAASRGVEEIRVAQGIYRPDRGGGNIPGDRTATFQLMISITIKGGFAGISEIDPEIRDVEIYVTVLSGDLNGDDVEVADPCDLWDEPTRIDNSYHVVTGAGIDETAIIVGFTIIGGNANTYPHSSGGGMYNRYGSPEVTNCTFTGNSAYNGGGMSNGSSNPTLTNCTFIANYADQGGGTYNGNSNPILVNCTFIANSADYYGGGGMYNFTSNPTLTDCAFIGNATKGYFAEGGGMYNKASNPILTNCTFTGNSAQNGYSALGGGMYNRNNSHPTLTNCTFTGNLARDGGGMYNSYSDPALTNCTFSGNLADTCGGGVYNNHSSPIVNNCIFNGNVADANDGGGMYNHFCSPILINCTFIDNSASDNGGGMHNKSSSPTLTHCIFSRNLANNGGGLHNLDSSSPILTNCIFNGNSANSGGGLYNIYGNHSLTNCTFSGNVANSGGGLYNGGGTLTFTNCILWGNSDNNGRGESGQIYGRKSVVNFSCIEGWTGTLEGVDNIGADPLFADPEEGDYHLKSETGRWDPFGSGWIKDDVTSPCIDAGDPNSPVGDEPEPNCGRINMGAYGGTAEASKSDYTWWFATTDGPVAAEGLGIILPHEHIFTDLRGPTSRTYGQANAADVVRVMGPLLEEARQKGVGLLIECSSIGVGRNASIIAQVAKASGLHVVVPTGVYGRANFAPAEHRNMSEDELTTLFINEIREGIDGTGIKAGFIKIATDNGPLTTLEEKFLRAAGRAASETGAAVASHTPIGSKASIQADILESINPAIRFIWVHAQNESNRSLHRQLAGRGVFIELDSLGWNPGQESTFITAIKELLAAGYGEQILLSHDAGWYQPGEQNGGTQKPYTYLVETFIPKLRNSGVDDEAIRMITETNPIRAFGFKSGE